MEYGLHSKFDIKKHKMKYIHYFETIITKDGEVHYAVPSHQEYLINLACIQRRITRDELINMCPKEYYFGFMEWLTMITETVAVWENFLIGEPNNSQKLTLQRLKDNGIYMGTI